MHREAKYNQVRADGEKIHALVQENLEYFQADEDSQMWRNYIQYLDDIVLDGVFNCIHCSLQYLLNNTDKENADMPPLLEAKLELQVSAQSIGEA